MKRHLATVAVLVSFVVALGFGSARLERRVALEAATTTAPRF
jgi:hypothetical protein